jgi:hypothetical protein
MTTDQLQRLHQARPFHPFDIHLADGRTLSVGHPEMLAMIPAGRTAGVALPDGTIEIVDLLLVTSLKPWSNGSRGRRRRRE